MKYSKLAKTKKMKHDKLIITKYRDWEYKYEEWYLKAQNENHWKLSSALNTVTSVPFACRLFVIFRPFIFMSSDKATHNVLNFSIHLRDQIHLNLLWGFYII